MCYLKIAYIIEQKQKEAQEEANAKLMGGAMATRTEGVSQLCPRETLFSHSMKIQSPNEKGMALQFEIAEKWNAIHPKYC